MANIKTTIDNMSQATILPEKPAEVEKPSPKEPTKVEIEAVVERLSKPWQYGKSWQRISKQTGVPLRVVCQIAEEYKRRKAELTPAAVDEKEVP